MRNYLFLSFLVLSFIGCSDSPTEANEPVVSSLELESKRNRFKASKKIGDLSFSFNSKQVERKNFSFDLYNRAFVEIHENHYKIFVAALSEEGYEFELQGTIQKGTQTIILPDSDIRFSGRTPGSKSRNIQFRPKRLNCYIQMNPTGSNQYLEFRMLGTMYEKPLSDKKFDRDKAAISMVSFSKIKLKKVNSIYSSLKNG